MERSALAPAAAFVGRPGTHLMAKVQRLQQFGFVLGFGLLYRGVACGGLVDVGGVNWQWWWFCQIWWAATVSFGLGLRFLWVRLA